MILVWKKSTIRIIRACVASCEARHKNDVFGRANFNMSYDLFFKPREASFSAADFHRYFRDRPNFKYEGNQAWYSNENTGVYFVFGFQAERDVADDCDDEHFPLSLNINFYRPSYFVHEAEPEVTAFVKYFDLLVRDPQMNGMGEGEYDAEKLLSGWHQGNEFGYSAILQDEKSRKDVAHLPADQLHSAWRWNLSIRGRQARIGEAKFVPRIVFLNLDGSTVTAAVWPDGIPVVITKVDYLLVPREALAPRKFFRKQKDSTLVAWDVALPILLKHGIQNEHGTIALNYARTPRAVAKFIRALPPESRTIVGVSADSVLDREIYQRSIA